MKSEVRGPRSEIWRPFVGTHSYASDHEALPGGTERAELQEWREVRGAGLRRRRRWRMEDGGMASFCLVRWLREQGCGSRRWRKVYRGWSAQGATIVGLGGINPWWIVCGEGHLSGGGGGHRCSSKGLKTFCSPATRLPRLPASPGKSTLPGNVLPRCVREQKSGVIKTSDARRARRFRQ